jgi:hypothetical protein
MHGDVHVVPLDLVDMDTCDISGPQDFGKGYTPEDLAWAFQALDDVVLPGLADGLTADDFRELDRRERRQGTRSYSDTLSNFLTADSSEPIRLSMQDNGLFNIENGRHRVWVAQQLGRTTIPARVLGLG